MKASPLFFIIPLALGGCALGPDYRKVDVDVPASFSEEEAATQWKEAAPQDHADKGEWWKFFGDAKLNELEAQSLNGNFKIKAAVARVDQARALARVARSQNYPSLSFNGSGSEFRQSTNRPQSNGANTPLTPSDVLLQADVAYELDIWGKVKRSVEASKADIEVSEAEYKTILLTLQSDVAQTYFSIRTLDVDLSILKDTIEIRKKALDLIQERYKGKIVSEIDVSQAQTLLANAEADMALAQKSRAELEHALAVLTGSLPEGFHLPERPLSIPPQSIPPGLPSRVLERRPDVAQAERMMAAANARIGVAKAAFFPAIQLTGAAGFESVDLGSVFNWSSRLWSVGPSMTLPIFDAGKNTANLNKAEALYLETVFVYREQVLTAFREVEDGLSGLRFLAKQAEALQRAVSASKRTYEIANTRYNDGLVTYLDVVDSERTYLENQRAYAQNLSQRYMTTVRLIKALGGGWQ